MILNRTQTVRSWLLTGFLVGSSLTLWNCSGNKKEANTEATTTARDSSVFGRQGDTTTNTLDAPQQAPVAVDSSSRGAVVPAQVNVRPKKTN